MFKFITKLFDSNDKQLKKNQVIVDEVSALESEFKKLTDDAIKKKVEEIKIVVRKQVEAIPKENRESIEVIRDRSKLPDVEKKLHEDLMAFAPEIFALTREVSRRKFNRRHFDVQIMAGLVLAQGRISEMKTGEGKTQVAWLPLSLYALTGRGAHLVTVNDYLAKIHGEYAGHIFSSLGLSVGIITSEKSYKFVSDDELEKIKGKDAIKDRKKMKIENPGDVNGINLIECSKREAYDSDIVYGTNNELGFDYLRDNMTDDISRLVQNELFFCIVDEVDSILIDEARTPLIISAPAGKSNSLYMDFAKLVKRLKGEEDYTIDEKARSVSLTDEGIEKVEKWLNISNLWEDYTLAHHLENALKAEVLYKNDDEYIVRDGEIVIIDEFTGRALAGRRYSEGLHQAIEAKEGVEIKHESKTLATITFQNFFRLYKHLAGMTGTAETESEEFYKIYGLEVVVIPTNNPVIRQDHTDRIYKNQQAKFTAVIKEIQEYHDNGQPILVGTTSVEKSEFLSRSLDKIGIDHQVLNAKHHESESKIIAQAGRKGSVTIATNMAGRGTDIKLGGDPFDQKRFEAVAESGGLHVIGTERHEARRIDNQLRGRSGRQGEPGSSRFYVALDDEIMRIQGGGIVKSLMERTNMPDDIPIESGLITRSIENAQKRVEGYNFDTRKHLVEYDDVMNQQREVFYKRRRKKLHQLKTVSSSENSDEKKLAAVEEDLKLKFIDEIQFIVDKHFFMDRDDMLDLEKVVDDFCDLAMDDLIVKSIKSIDSKANVKNVKTFLQDKMKKFEKEDVQEYLEKVSEQMWIEKSKSFKNENDLLYIAILVFLQTNDELWSEHLDAMQDLREGIGLRQMAQRDPLVEYKNESISYFERYINLVDSQYAHRIMKIKQIEAAAPSAAISTNVEEIKSQDDYGMQVQKLIQGKGNTKSTSAVRTTKTVVKEPKMKLGRNDLCWCGSGKKYKKCHGKNK